jgi:serine protease Do
MPVGVYIADVEDNSGAEAAGIKSGDIIVSFDGSEIKEEDTIKDILKKHKIGDSVPAKVWRDGKTFDVTIKLMDSKGN